MKHIVLLGDSIFDNKAYVRNLDVISHLRQQIPNDWQATLRAMDRCVIEDVKKQTLGLPADATHLIVSVGGNNAILNAGILQQPATSSAEVLNELADLASTF